MARRASLRMVSEASEPSEPAKPMTVASAAESGTQRDLLVALRARIAADIDNPNTPPRDLAALSMRLLAIAKEIGAIDAHAKVDGVGRAAATPDEEWSAS